MCAYVHVCVIKWVYPDVFVNAPGSYEMGHRKRSVIIIAPRWLGCLHSYNCIYPKSVKCLWLQDGSGAIDKDELRELFVDMFPTFNKYVETSADS